MLKSSRRPILTRSFHLDLFLLEVVSEVPSWPEVGVDGDTEEER
jgi:hypothetical protein